MQSSRTTRSSSRKVVFSSGDGEVLDSLALNKPILPVLHGPSVVSSGGNAIVRKRKLVSHQKKSPGIVDLEEDPDHNMLVESRGAIDSGHAIQEASADRGRQSIQSGSISDNRASQSAPALTSHAVKSVSSTCCRETSTRVRKTKVGNPPETPAGRHPVARAGTSATMFAAPQATKSSNPADRIAHRVNKSKSNNPPESSARRNPVVHDAVGASTRYSEDIDLASRPLSKDLPAIPSKGKRSTRCVVDAAARASKNNVQSAKKDVPVIFSKGKSSKLSVTSNAQSESSSKIKPINSEHASSSRKLVKPYVSRTALKDNHNGLVPALSHQHRKKQQQQPLPIEHIKSEVSVSISGIFHNPPIKPVGERCQWCKHDLAFLPTGSATDSNQLPVQAVLPCGHCYHLSCSENIFGPPEPSCTPPCIACLESGVSRQRPSTDIA